MSFFKKFRRVTYSTSYLPEIDGLRFLAIFSVVVMLHVTHYMDDKLFNRQLIPDGYWKNFVMEGGNGVALFFIISGFILSLPFAKWRLNKQKKIPLKYYYLRRLTRLEPPYFIALVILFIPHVWILGNYSFNELLPHFFASAFYMHYFIYGNISLVLPVAWSLEVEVQFYILAPLICMLFLIKSRVLRWVIFSTLIIGSVFYWFDVWGETHLLVYLHYFLTGMLLADLYCCRINLFKNQLIGLIAGLLALSGFFFIPTIHNLPGTFAKLACMFILFHTVLVNSRMKKIFSAKLIILIGGMCYSIYLLHYATVSAVGYLLIKSGIQVSNLIHAVIIGGVMTAMVLIICSFFFLYVEKPFMKPLGLKKLRKN